MDVYGQLVSAQVENLSADPTGIVGRLYYNTGTNVFKYYDGTWRTLVNTVTALSNPMSAPGQMIYGAASGVPTVVAAGTAGQILASNGTSAPAFTDTISTLKTFSAGYKGNAPATVRGTFSVTSGFTGSPSSGTVATPAWMTSIAFSGGGAAVGTGTITYTFARTGYYVLLAQLGTVASVAYSSAVTMRHTITGTATIESNQSSDTQSTPTPVNDQNTMSQRLINVTSAGQTVAVVVTASGTVSSGTLSGIFNHTIFPL